MNVKEVIPSGVICPKDIRLPVARRVGVAISPAILSEDSTRPLLIGQAPGPNSRPDLPLFPYPRTSAGARLQRMGGFTRGQYLRSFDRINLLNEFPGSDPTGRGDRFPPLRARRAADRLRFQLVGRRVVLVGRRVSEAFGYAEMPFFEWFADGFECVVIPHTSGVSRSYNDPEAQESLKRVMQRALDPAPVI